tara:strand:+ start:214 stop:495 length:282 start_codon:yes stop_codon:yes gene_type:complete
MKVVIDDIEIQVRNISYRQKKGLQGEYRDVYSRSDKIKQKDFNLLLASVAEIAFSDPEEAFKDYDGLTEDKILIQTLMDYLEISDESKKIKGD